MPIQMSPIIDSRVAEQIVDMAPSHRTAVNCHPHRRAAWRHLTRARCQKKGCVEATRTHNE